MDPLRAALPWLRHKNWCNVKADDPPDTERCKCGLRAALASEAREPGLDVERLARALEAAMSGNHVIPLTLRSEFGLPPIWEPLAAAIAAEYAALASEDRR